MGKNLKMDSLLLGPSVFSGTGFMGNDKRALEEIIADDQKALHKANASKEKLASALSIIHEKAKAALGDPVQLAPGLTAVYYESRGKIPSPFPGEGTFEKGEVVVREKAKDVLVLTALSLHLIKKHGFFQGSGSRFRVDVEKTVALLRHCQLL